MQKAVCAAIVIAFFFLSLSNYANALRHKGGKLLLKKIPRNIPASQFPEPQWFVQVLDHFNPNDTRTWKQRYYVNDTHWDRPTGPVFLFISGEAPADPEWLSMNSEFMLNAAKYKALAVMLEHRYYGESHPTPDASVNNLQYLSSRQALEDIVNFKKVIMDMYNLTNNSWVSFGGSYPGALSAWLRIKYPQTVVGAVATSGPVQAQLDFHQYLQVVRASLATSEEGIHCDNVIRKATTQLGKMLKDKSQWEVVEKLFHIRPPLQNEDDVSLFSEILTGYFMETVQYNNLVGPLNLEVLCAIMTNASIGTPLQRYAVINERFLTLSAEQYLNANFSEYVEDFKQDGWDAESVYSGERLWYYQTCAEFGYYQTTDSPHQPFGHLLGLSHYTKLCSLVYDIKLEAINKSVESTNAYYGGRNVPKNATNIVFPNGSIDPWHALGVLHNISDSLVAIFIEGTSHCANMEEPSSSDPPSLKYAREEITYYIGKWLSEAQAVYK